MIAIPGNVLLYFKQYLTFCNECAFPMNMLSLIPRKEADNEFLTTLKLYLQDQ